MVDKMLNLKRTHYCTEVNEKDIDKKIVVCGFVQKVRNMGNLLFIDLRDRTGILQLAFNAQTPEETFAKAESVRSEFVIMAGGTLSRRTSINKELPTGELELLVSELLILAESETPPFEVKDDTTAREELRLKYRFLDLRRPELQKALLFRHQVTAYAHEFFNKHGFIEVETPDLIRSTPEGARDYLVPSRMFPGSFFALPQSPQLYKQLLMVAGIDKYMQIAKCFRDEDLRADRQPEFTQIDLEMSFVDEEDIMSINEQFIAELFRKTLNKEVKTPFLRLTYKEAMERFGSDKPDLRFGVELQDLSDIVKESNFSIFKDAVKNGGSVRAINVKGAADVLTRKEIDKLTDIVKTYKANGLAYTRLLPDSKTSSYEKFLTEQEAELIKNTLNAQDGDVILIVADKKDDVVLNSLGNLRVHLGNKLGLIPKDQFNFLWVTEFPLLEFDEEENRFVAKHHPFTSPNFEDLDLIHKEPAKVRARAYDMVLNGCEVGGGSIRINNIELQQEMFDLLGLSKEEANEKFGFLLEAFKFGAPPHGGMAYGLDRLVMLMLQKDTIRDVIAFPKVQNSRDLMTECPSLVPQGSLAELGIDIKNKDKT